MKRATERLAAVLVILSEPGIKRISAGTSTVEATGHVDDASSVAGWRLVYLKDANKEYEHGLDKKIPKCGNKMCTNIRNIHIS